MIKRGSHPREQQGRDDNNEEETMGYKDDADNVYSVHLVVRDSKESIPEWYPSFISDILPLLLLAQMKFNNNNDTEMNEFKG